MVGEWKQVVQSFVAFLSITLNAVVIYSIYKRRLYIKTTDIFIVHLAVADILVGLVYIPFYKLSVPQLDFWECLTMHTIILMINNNAIIMLMCVTVDRFFAVRFPLHYNRFIDTTTANRVLLAVWAVSILTGSVPWFWNKGSENYSSCKFTEVVTRKYLVYYNFFFVNGIPLVAIVCIYIYINTVVRRINRLDRRLTNRFHTKTPKSSRKYYAPVLLISVVAVLTLPVHVMDTLFYFEVIPKTEETLTAIISFVLLKNFNSIINPFIYASRYLIIKDRLSATFRTSTSRIKGQTSAKLLSTRSTTLNDKGSKNAEIVNVAPISVSDFSKQSTPISVLADNSPHDSFPTLQSHQ